jgi:hypothetical protein
MLSRLKVFSTHYLGFVHPLEARDLSGRQSTGLGDAAQVGKLMLGQPDLFILELWYRQHMER